MNDSQKQLSALSLIAVIIGSTIGSGIFTITADMAAAGAHTGAILIGWLICGIGMSPLMEGQSHQNGRHPVKQLHYIGAEGARYSVCDTV